jgi:hypothetical protein
MFWEECVEMLRPSAADLLLLFGSMPGKSVARLVCPTSARQRTDLGLIIDLQWHNRFCASSYIRYILRRCTSCRSIPSFLELLNECKRLCNCETRA